MHKDGEYSEVYLPSSYQLMRATDYTLTVQEGAFVGIGGNSKEKSISFTTMQIDDIDPNPYEIQPGYLLPPSVLDAENRDVFKIHMANAINAENAQIVATFPSTGSTDVGHDPTFYLAFNCKAAIYSTVYEVMVYNVTGTNADGSLEAVPFYRNVDIEFTGEITAFTADIDQDSYSSSATPLFRRLSYVSALSAFRSIYYAKIKVSNGGTFPPGNYYLSVADGKFYCPDESQNKANTTASVAVYFTVVDGSDEANPGQKTGPLLHITTPTNNQILGEPVESVEMIFDRHVQYGDMNISTSIDVVTQEEVITETTEEVFDAETNTTINVTTTTTNLVDVTTTQTTYNAVVGNITLYRDNVEVYRISTKGVVFDKASVVISGLTDYTSTVGVYRLEMESIQDTHEIPFQNGASGGLGSLTWEYSLTARTLPTVSNVNSMAIDSTITVSEGSPILLQFSTGVHLVKNTNLEVTVEGEFTGLSTTLPVDNEAVTDLLAWSQSGMKAGDNYKLTIPADMFHDAYYQYVGETVIDIFVKPSYLFRESHTLVGFATRDFMVPVNSRGNKAYHVGGANLPVGEEGDEWKSSPPAQINTVSDLHKREEYCYPSTRPWSACNCGEERSAERYVAYGSTRDGKRCESTHDNYPESTFAYAHVGDYSGFDYDECPCLRCPMPDFEYSFLDNFTLTQHTDLYHQTPVGTSRQLNCEGEVMDEIGRTIRIGATATGPLQCLISDEPQYLRQMYDWADVDCKGNPCWVENFPNELSLNASKSCNDDGDGRMETGDVCDLICDPGFEFNESTSPGKQYYECQFGDYINRPECIRRTCPDVTTPDGLVFPEECINSTYTDVCEAKCAPGWEPVADNPMKWVCTTSGGNAVSHVGFDGVIPACQRVVCPGGPQVLVRIEEEQVQFSTEIIYHKIFAPMQNAVVNPSYCYDRLFEDRCRVTCDEGYVDISPTSEVGLMCGPDGHYVDMPNCTRQMCRTPTNPSFGKFVHDDGSDCVTPFGGTECKLACDYGYTLATPQWPASKCNNIPSNSVKKCTPTTSVVTDDQNDGDTSSNTTITDAQVIDPNCPLPNAVAELEFEPQCWRKGI